jgi:uncharacterized protein YlaI
MKQVKQNFKALLLLAVDTVDDRLTGAADIKNKPFST